MSLYFYEGYDGENEVLVRSDLFDNEAVCEECEDQQIAATGHQE